MPKQNDSNTMDESLAQRLEDLECQILQLQAQIERNAVLMAILVRHANGAPRAMSPRNNAVVRRVLYPDGADSRSAIAELEDIMISEGVGV